MGRGESRTVSLSLKGIEEGWFSSSLEVSLVKGESVPQICGEKCLWGLVSPQGGEVWQVVLLLVLDFLLVDIVVQLGIVQCL